MELFEMRIGLILLAFLSFLAIPDSQSQMHTPTPPMLEDKDFGGGGAWGGGEVDVSIERTDSDSVLADLRRILIKNGMSMVKTDTPHTLSAVKLDKPGSKDGDYVSVTLTRDWDRPTEKIHIALTYERFVMYWGHKDLTKVALQDPGITRYNSINSDIYDLVNKAETPSKSPSSKP